GFDGSIHRVRFDGCRGAGDTNIAVHRTGVHPHALGQLHREVDGHVIVVVAVVVRVVAVFVTAVAFIPQGADGDVAAVVRDDEVDALRIGVAVILLGGVDGRLVTGRGFDIHGAIQVTHGEPAARRDAARPVEGVAVLCFR